MPSLARNVFSPNNCCHPCIDSTPGGSLDVLLREDDDAVIREDGGFIVRET